jgi:hypothetical protein
MFEDEIKMLKRMGVRAVSAYSSCDERWILNCQRDLGAAPNNEFCDGNIYRTNGVERTRASYKY